MPCTYKNKLEHDTSKQVFYCGSTTNKKDCNLNLIDTLIERSLFRRSDLSKIKELERKSVKEKNILPGKLVDCTSKTY